MVKEPKGMKDLPLTPLSHPSVASMGKTGSWRTFRPIVDTERCTGCLLCWVFCPEGCVVRREDDIPKIDYEYCKGCGVCANECRVGAIKMERE